MYNSECIFFPRHLACDEERVEAAKLLVEHGASIYIENKEEKTPLQIAKGGLGTLLRRIVEGWCVILNLQFVFQLEPTPSKLHHENSHPCQSSLNGLVWLKSDWRQVEDETVCGRIVGLFCILLGSSDGALKMLSSYTFDQKHSLLH